MKKGETKSPKIESDPMLAGVDDNPIYRLLGRHGNWHRPSFQLYRRNGIDQFFNFQDWVWDDLDVCPLTARDYAYALWAIHAPAPTPKSKARFIFPIFFILYMSLICWLEYFSVMKNANEAVTGGYLIWSSVLGYQFMSLSHPSARMPVLLAQLHSARSFEHKIGYIFCFSVLFVIALFCEGAFWSFQVKTVAMVMLKYIAGGIVAFSSGMTIAWLSMKFVKPSPQKILNHMAKTIDLLNEQRRQNRDHERHNEGEQSSSPRAAFEPDDGTAEYRFDGNRSGFDL